MRFARNVLAVLVLLAALAVLAAWTCPAAILYRHFGSRLEPLRLRGIEGTLWHGHAAGAELFGQAIGALDWDVSVGALLRGAPSARLAVTGATISGDGRFERLAGGAVALHDAHLRLPAHEAAPALGIPALDMLGTIVIAIDEARFTAAWPSTLVGSARWHDAAVAGAAQAQLGELQATFSTGTDAVVNGTVADVGGPLELSGTFQASITRYRAQARLAARGDNPQLVEALQYIGQPRADGSRELLIEGRTAF